MKNNDSLFDRLRSYNTYSDNLDHLLLKEKDVNRKRWMKIFFFLLLSGLFYCGALSSRAQTSGLNNGSSNQTNPPTASRAIFSGAPETTPIPNGAPSQSNANIQNNANHQNNINNPNNALHQSNANFQNNAASQNNVTSQNNAASQNNATLQNNTTNSLTNHSATQGSPSVSTDKFDLRAVPNSSGTRPAASERPVTDSGSILSGAPSPGILPMSGPPTSATSTSATSTSATSTSARSTSAGQASTESTSVPSTGSTSTESLPASGGSSPKDLPRLPANPQMKDLLDKTEYLTSEKGIVDSLKVFLVLTVLSLVPAIFMMTTSFIRLVTVLSILRQALGTGQIPPNQVITALSVFLTFLIMMPAWTEVYEKSLVPYSHQEITAAEAFERGQLPIRTFLWKQIEKTGNTDMIWTFMKYAPDAKTPKYYEEIPWRVLLPAFMLSELKTAFLIGFQIFLPFVIIDMIVSAVMVSMGMMMLPPTVISLPFKLLLFVLMDGWSLTAKMLLESFTWLGTGG